MNYVIGLPGASPRFIMQGNLQNAQMQAKAGEVCFAQAIVPSAPYAINSSGTALASSTLDPAKVLEAAWAEVRMTRDAKLNYRAWTVTRPNALTTACRDAWAAWFETMDRLTIDYAEPSAVIWPEEPAMVYVPAQTSPD